jgi:hypothetical protein
MFGSVRGVHMYRGEGRETGVERRPRCFSEASVWMPAAVKMGRAVWTPEQLNAPSPARLGRNELSEIVRLVIKGGLIQLPDVMMT